MIEDFQYVYARFRAVLMVILIAASLFLGLYKLIKYIRDYFEKDVVTLFYNTCCEGDKEGQELAYVYDVHIPTAEEIAEMIEQEKKDEEDVEEESRSIMNEVMGSDENTEYV